MGTIIELLSVKRYGKNFLCHNTVTSTVGDLSLRNRFIVPIGYQVRLISAGLIHNNAAAIDVNILIEGPEVGADKTISARGVNNLYMLNETSIAASTYHTIDLSPCNNPIFSGGQVIDMYVVVTAASKYLETHEMFEIVSEPAGSGVQ